MGFTAIALVAGIVLGLVTGGRPRNVTLRPLRGIEALAGAVVLQAVPQLVDVSGTTGLACVLGSYVLLLAFALANIRLVGMPVILVGLVLNVVVIGLNGGMPVRAEAIFTIDRHAKLEEIDFGAKRHLEDGTGATGSRSSATCCRWRRSTRSCRSATSSSRPGWPTSCSGS